MDEAEVIKVDMNNLYRLSSLPSCLVELYCGYNQLSQLPALPETLRVLNCPHNRLTQLPPLPYLTVLDITANYISRLCPPVTLTMLYCSFNHNLKIPTLPDGLKEFHCCNNGISSIELPPRVEVVYCSYNQIESIRLPVGLTELYCDHNRLNRLVLHDSLQILDCVDNHLNSLNLPHGLRELSCSYNNITSLTLNKRLIRLNLSGNPIISVPVLHRGITFLNLNHTQVEGCFDFGYPLDKNGGLYLYDTPLYSKMKAVLQTEVIDQVMIKLSFEMITMIERKFKENYYGCKVKERMMEWLWRSRETLAMRKYHPDELWKHLACEDYVDALDQWSG